mgnify:CR=1 FL=1
MKDLLNDLRNLVDFPLRQLFRWRRKGLVFQNQSKDHLYSFLSSADRQKAEEKTTRYVQEYHLDYLYNHSSRSNFCENLFYIEMLEQGLSCCSFLPKESICVGDIGVSTWFYVQGYYHFLRFWKTDHPRTVHLSGYEIDPYRVMPNFYSRYDHAVAHIGPNQEIQFVPAGFFPQPDRFDLLTMFFPFVFVNDHLEWGLPHTCFSPGALLKSAWLSVKTGGVLFVVNQGEAEHRAYHKLMMDLSINPEAGFRFDSLFYLYAEPRYILVALKHG